MAKNNIDLDELKGTVIHLRSVLQGMLGEKNVMLAAVETVWKNQIGEIRKQIHAESESAAEQGLSEIEQLYAECEGMLANTQPAGMVGDLSRVRDKLEITRKFYSDEF